jgi:hypothetical protein
VFVTRPSAGPPVTRDLCLLRTMRGTFTGPAAFLADAGTRARIAEYLADMARPYGKDVPAALFGEPPSPALGHSYAEMAQALIGPIVPADEPVDLLVLAFSIHDLRPGRQTAAFLSHGTTGAPMAFAISDQGSAAAFSGLRIARAYASSADVRRALLLVVEQAALPYRSEAPLPSEHRAVAMLYGDGDGGAPQALAPQALAPQALVTAVRQHPGSPAGCVADLAAADLKELAAGHPEVGLVLGDALAPLWTAPAADRVRVMPPGQPSTGVWWGLIDELAGGAGHPGLVVVADYDAELGYLCLAAFDADPSASQGPAPAPPGAP